MLRGRQFKFVRGGTPYHWSMHDSGWRIGFGPSSFLIAEGSGFSISVGRKLLASLQDEWRNRKSRRASRETDGT